MRKFVVVMIVAIISAISVSICSAYDYDSDPNYKFIGNGNGGTWYLDLSSIDVQEYNPPHYQIAGTFIHVSGDASVGYSDHYTVKRYNWYAKETYHRNDYGNWVKDEVSARNMASAQTKAFANALFYAAYGMNFY